jgi:predicted aldo/keto reductase-like oxidoreductase
MTTNTGELTDAEKAVMIVLPRQSGALIRSLAIKSPQFAKDFAYEAATLLAFNIIRKWSDESFAAVLQGMQVMKHHKDYKDTLEYINEQKNKFDRDAEEFLRSADLPEAAELIERYAVIMNNIPTTTYVVASDATGK